MSEQKPSWLAGLFTVKSIGVGVLVLGALGYAGYAGYSYFTKQKEDPNTPELVFNKLEYKVGDLVDVRVKHNIKTATKTAVTWRIYDNLKEKTDIGSCSPDNIFFGSGIDSKTYTLHCYVSYLVDGEIKSYVLMAQIKIGNGPIPPPPPPPIPDPVFPNEIYKLSSFTYKEFNKINHEKRLELARGFANNFNTYIAAISAGTQNNSEVVLKAVNALNIQTRNSLQVSNTVTDPFWLNLQKALIDIDNMHGLENIQNLKQAFIEIRDGLQAIK